jgi:hypothetical protein
MKAAPDMPAGLARWGMALVWLLTAAVLIYVDRDRIAQLSFQDPDDALRFVEVRDWMAGQSWFDTSQYRSWPPAGAPMHWSRLVDIPIAGMIHLAGLFAAPPLAERIALVVVPLLTLLLLFAVVHALTRRVTGRGDMALVAAVMLALSLGVLVQFHPLRIDHHGWHITLSTLGVLMLARSEGGCARYAALAGFVIAVSLTVAIEGLPIAVGIGAVLAFRYLRREEEGRALAAYLLALTAMSALLPVVMLGWPAAGVPWCDSLSPAYVLPMAAATLVLLATWRLAPRHRAARLAVLALAGGAGAAVFAGYSRQCLGGPFSALDPLVYNVWYVSISEGMPIWTQSLDLKVLIPLPSLLGLAGTLLAIRLDVPERREAWIALLFLQLLAFAVSLTVMRAMGLAHLLALPGCAWLFVTAFRATRRMRTSGGRIILGAGCIVLTPIGAEAIAAGFLPVPAESAETKDDGGACLTGKALRGLNALPQGVIFAPLDIGSHLLAYTRHSVVSTGHHRNRPGMKTVISAFLAPPDKARAIVEATPAHYLAFCPSADEAGHYAKLEPHGLMAGLLKGRAPGWLQPVPMREGEPIRVYQIMRAGQPATKRIATPFMQ